MSIAFTICLQEMCTLNGWSPTCKANEQRATAQMAKNLERDRCLRPEDLYNDSVVGLAILQLKHLLFDLFMRCVLKVINTIEILYRNWWMFKATSRHLHVRSWINGEISTSQVEWKLLFSRLEDVITLPCRKHNVTAVWNTGCFEALRGAPLLSSAHTHTTVVACVESHQKQRNYPLEKDNSKSDSINY